MSGRNFILPERLLIALQAQLSQPRQDVHGVPSRAIKSAALVVIRTTIGTPPNCRVPSRRNDRPGSKRISDQFCLNIFNQCLKVATLADNPG
jgi:hypothetical protein